MGASSSLSPLHRRHRLYIVLATLTFVLWTIAAHQGEEEEEETSSLLTRYNWPSLKLHFTLKRNSMQIFGQREFNVYMEPVVSTDGYSLRYNGYVDFNDASRNIRYSIVDGIAYATIMSPENDQDPTQQQSSSSHCLEQNMLSPLNQMIHALNHAVPIASGSLGGVTIHCAVGNLFKVTLQGLKMALCASGASGVHVYDSDMEVQIKYLKKALHIPAPQLPVSADKSKCKTIVEPMRVTPTAAALLTGTDVPENESRSPTRHSNVSLASTTCSCQSKRRPCLFVHGLGVDHAKTELQDTFSDYWGNLSDSAPCCTDFKYMIWNSMATSWYNRTQQQLLCDLATSLSPSSSSTEIADTIVVTHSMGGLVLAGAIATGKCRLAKSSSWIATSPPMGGSMGSDYAQESCDGKHTMVMKAIGLITDECPIPDATKSVAYEGGNFSSSVLDSAYEAVQRVYRRHVYAVMCSNWYSGLVSHFQAMYWMLGAGLPHKSEENDGLVEFQSCAGGLPLDAFHNHYRHRFYVTELNHADTTFYNGDGLFNSAKKPLKWFECVL